MFGGSIYAILIVKERLKRLAVKAPDTICKKEIGKMKYAIGEFSSMLGVTPETLRLYEKYNILNPEKNQSNRYRYYHDLDARKLLMSRWYRGIGLTVQETADLVKDADLQKSLFKIGDIENNLEKEIRYKTLKLKRIMEIRKELNMIDYHLNQCFTIETQGIFRIKQTVCNDLLKNRTLEKITSQWMNYLPYTFFSFKIPEKTWLNAPLLDDYSWGLAISEEHAKVIGPIELNDQIEYLKPQTCVSAVILSDQHHLLSKEHLMLIMEYMEKNHFQIAGDITGQLLVNDKSSSGENSYLKLLVPYR